MDLQLLEETQRAFMNWQSQNKSKRAGYPKALKEQAVKLLAHYPAKRLSQQLGISRKSLRNWLATCTAQAPLSSAFVPLDLAADQPTSLCPETQQHSAPSIRLKLPHQMELILPLNSRGDIAQWISALVKELNACCI